MQEHPAVAKAQRPLTMHLSPKEVFLALEVQFKPELHASELIEVVDELEKNIHQQHPNVGRIFIETEWVRDSKNAPPQGNQTTDD